MWLTFSLFIVGLMPAVTAQEHANNTIENTLSPPNSTALPSNNTEDGITWADTNNTPDCENNTCVRKCCGKDKLFSFDSPTFGCNDTFPGEPKFEVALKHKDGRPTESSKPLLLLVGFVHDVNNCSTAPLPSHRKGHLLANGSFYTAYENKYRDHWEYCLEVLRKPNEGTSLSAMTCYTEAVETARTLFRKYSHPIGLIASCIALIIVVLCHVLIPKLRDLQGKCLLSHVCSLLVGNVALLSATLWHSFSNWQCVAIGIILHTAFIATYMWLTVMCFDIWRFVRMSVKGIPVQNLIGGEQRLFLSYCGAAWGLTAAIAVITCTLQFLPADALSENIIRPHFGVNRCFIIEDDANLFVYFFVILGSLCLLNVFLVCKTAHYLYGGGLTFCRRCRSSKVTDTESAVFNAKHLDIFWQRFQIFITTIVVWGTEVLSFKIPPKEMWELTDLLNTLQGVIILLIFMRQKKKRTMVLERFRQITDRAQKAVHKITNSDETSNTCVTNDTILENLSGSDKETIENIRKLSKQEETVTSTILKSVSQNKISMKQMTPLKVEAQNTRSGVDMGLVDDGNQRFIEIDLGDRGEHSSHSKDLPD